MFSFFLIVIYTIILQLVRQGADHRTHADRSIVKADHSTHFRCSIEPSASLASHARSRPNETYSVPSSIDAAADQNFTRRRHSGGSPASVASPTRPSASPSSAPSSTTSTSPAYQHNHHEGQNGGHGHRPPVAGVGAVDGAPPP